MRSGVTVELTDEQRAVAGHAGGRLRIVGGHGHGKSTALLARYLTLVRIHQPSRLLMVCRSSAAANRFRDAVLPHLAGGFDALPITSWVGVAFGIVGRAGGDRLRLLPPAEQRRTVAELLTRESRADWPLTGRFLGRDAFVEEVTAALTAFRTRAATGAEASGAWLELAPIAERYRHTLAANGQIDRVGLLTEAARLSLPGAYAHVLVDDLDGRDPVMAHLLAALTGPDGGATIVAADPGDPAPWPATDIALTTAFRHPRPSSLITCRHPSAEPEAVAAELLAARSAGVAWADMAVLVRRPRVHGRRMVGALLRHGIPVAPGHGFGSPTRDPAATAILDMARWVCSPVDTPLPAGLLASPLAGLGADGLVALRSDLSTDASTSTLGELAFMIWERGLGHLTQGDRPDDAALDAVVGLLTELDRAAGSTPQERLAHLAALADVDYSVDREPGISRPSEDAEAVTVTSIADAAGREWDTVVLTGCVEGELPRIRGRGRVFEPALLKGDDSPPSPAVRRRQSLADERRLFAMARSRATGQTIATAAPQPGVLLSRFVEDFEHRPERRPAARPAAPSARLSPTTGVTAVFPDGRLVLSASQLDTYDDCPLRYAYQYGLRIRDGGGAAAALGTLVHEVLAEFLDPDRSPDAPARSKDELLALGAERWTDDIASYRPQIEECRRDYFAMLEGWWESEGDGPTAPEVLAVEHRFDVEVGDVRLIGAIDRIDRAADDGLRIVDYKTGRHEPRADTMADDLQLAVYHLAATRDPALASLGTPRALRLLFLRTMRAYEQPIAADHAETTEVRVAQAAAAIRSEDFEPAVDASCRYCSFHRLCPLQAAGREVGAS